VVLASGRLAPPRALEHVKALAQHPDFTLTNPNRVRALYMAFAANPPRSTPPTGEGYRIIADLILALDPINGNVAARFVAPLGRWRRIAGPRRADARRTRTHRRPSWPVARCAEQVGKSLEGRRGGCRSSHSPGADRAAHGFLGRRGGVSTGFMPGSTSAGARTIRQRPPKTAARAVEAVLPGARLAPIRSIRPMW
jgi:hypothetical protein